MLCRPVVLRCVALCGDLLFVVSCGCVPVALRCVVLHCVAICCVFFGPVVLRCVVLLFFFCYAYVVFSSLSLRCVFPVVLRFVRCLLSLVFCWFPLS